MSEITGKMMQDEGRKPSHPINETRSPGEGAVGPIRSGGEPKTLSQTLI